MGDQELNRVGKMGMKICLGVGKSEKGYILKTAT
jgi:hypothetical protein